MTQSPSPRRRAQPFGFTLIELLVVISIIALLIGILLPALGAARETARGTLCQSNMRNVSTAFYSYAADNDMYIPGRSAINPVFNDPENRARGWLVRGWLTANGTAPTDPIQDGNVDLSPSAIWEYLGGSDQPSVPGEGAAAVLACPSDEFSSRSSGVSITANAFLWHYANDRDPAVFARMGSAQSAGGRGTIPVSNAFLSLDVVRSPGSLIMLIDEGGPDDNTAVNPPFARGVNDGLFEAMSLSPQDAKDGIHNEDGDKSKWYHSENASFGFADGHGELRNKFDNEVTGFSNQTYPGRTFRGYGELWDPLGEAPRDPTTFRAPGGRS